MDDEPKRPVAMCLTELNSCEDDANDHAFRPMFEADDIQVVVSYSLTLLLYLLVFIALYYRRSLSANKIS